MISTHMFAVTKVESSNVIRVCVYSCESDAEGNIKYEQFVQFLDWKNMKLQDKADQLSMVRHTHTRMHLTHLMHRLQLGLQAPGLGLVRTGRQLPQWTTQPSWLTSPNRTSNTSTHAKPPLQLKPCVDCVLG